MSDWTPKAGDQVVPRLSGAIWTEGERVVAHVGSRLTTYKKTSGPEISMLTGMFVRDFKEKTA